MKDFKTQLASLVGEGSSIVQGIESSLSFISLGKAIAPHVLEKGELKDLENLVKNLDLPSPVHQAYLRYVQWNRDCESLFRRLGLAKSFQYKEFVGLKKEVRRAISRKRLDQRAILLKIKEQISILSGLEKLNMEKLRKETRKPRVIRRKTNQRKKKLFLTFLYILGCIFLDVILFPIITLYIIGLIAVEVTILFGIPRLLEWFTES